MIFNKVLNGRNLSFKDIADFLKSNESKISIEEYKLKEIERAFIEISKCIENNNLIYGVNTSLGILKNRTIAKDVQEEFSKNILLSHSTTSSSIFGYEISKLSMLIKLNQLILGNIVGVSKDLVNRYLEYINKNIYPVTYQDGSLGIGDLPPQAEMGLAIIGSQYGKLFFKNQQVYSQQILPKLNIKLEYKLKPGEAIAIVSGNSVLSAGTIFALIKSEKLLKIFDATFSLFFESTSRYLEHLDLRPIKMRGLFGEIKSTNNILRYIKGSKWTIKKETNT